MLKERPIVLSVAGFDPCGGAGVLADIKVMEQHGAQGMAVITANTIQTENEVVGLKWQELGYLLNGIATLAKRYSIKVIKIGIVPGVSFLKNIIDTIEACIRDVFIIWDPVIRSSSGLQFFKLDDLRHLHKVSGNINLITPNYIEYDLLKAYWHLDGKNAILIKGGHRSGSKGTDVLIHDHKEIVISPVTVNTFEKHGSGCVLSAAIASNIALGKTLADACRLGKIYVEQFLNSHPSLLGYHSYVK